MKRLFLALCLLASPLAAQPSRFSLATQVQPGFATTALGDTYCAANATTFGRIVGNATTTRKFSISLGTGSVSACPVWNVLVSGDIPNNAANTTGSAAKWTTARLLAGNSVDGSANATFANKFILQGTTDAGTTAAQFLGALGTGVLKNTTTTGVLSIAAAGDFPAMVASGASHSAGMAPDPGASAGTTKYLREDATYAVPAGGGGGSGSVDGISVVTLVAGTGMTISDNTPGAGQITLTSSGGGGGGTVATKGDIQTFSTTAANLAVGTNGTVPTADSTVATGLSYQWPGVGTLRTLKETVFAGVTPTSYTTGNNYTIDGSSYACFVDGNGAVDMVATGLRCRRGNTGGNDAFLQINAGATGDFNSIVGEGRFRRGQWGIWTHAVSYDYTTASGVVYAGATIMTTYPYWGVRLSRNKNLTGAPNTAVGGFCMDYWWNNAQPGITSYVGVATADVWLAYFRTPLLVDIYYGTWSSGWPTMEAMSYAGTILMNAGSQYLLAQATVARQPLAANIYMSWGNSGNVASSGTYEIVYDRWRITTWE